MTREERRKRDAEDLRQVLSQPWGRRFVFRLITQAGLYSSSYAESSTGTAFNEGRRSIAIALLQECQLASGELYRRGLREALDNEDRDAVALQRKPEEEE